MEMDSWFCLYPADLITDTSHLSPHDFGAYVRILCRYYKTGPIANNQEDLRNISGVESADWIRCWGRLSPFFTENEDGRIHQKRADEEIAKREDRQRKIRGASAMGVASRREKGQLNTTQGTTDGPTDGPTDGYTVGHTDGRTQSQLQSQLQSKVQRQVQEHVRPPNPPLGGTRGNGIWEPTELQLRLNCLFGRKSTTRWVEKEVRALRALQPIDEEELCLIESYYKASIPKDKDHRRHDLGTLLNNFSGEVDRARKFNGTRKEATEARKFCEKIMSDL